MSRHITKRRGRDSNPRTRLTPVTRFPVAPVQPLRHLSRRFLDGAPLGYDKQRPSVARLRFVLLASSAAFSKTFGLLVTFVGIGLIVNILLVYVAIQIRGERRQNQELLTSRKPPES